MFSRSAILAAVLAVGADAFAAPPSAGRFAVAKAGLPTAASRGIALRGGASGSQMIDITPNVSFDTIAREWRCKWSEDNDKASLVAAQEAIEEVIKDVKAVKGVKGVQRVVCGGCLDFKIVTSLPAEDFGKWEEAKFAPEEKFIEKLKGIKGVSQVETQTYTNMPL
eukprot:CAMPEP_0174930140 /NCGR_PEP_ID=MMETSP1355-20121228/30395_1 /TAXON_ID=464990 /ORGANISM="Hemiselmis tepida, Strain CCMP443" /LENGTH=165 /DNA_ID=CAMNT_0016176405 /DNA_START=22 /DNA_END=519 /DNA_ORIENTATION=+